MSHSIERAVAGLLDTTRIRVDCRIQTNVFCTTLSKDPSKARSIENITSIVFGQVCDVPGTEAVGRLQDEDGSIEQETRAT